MFSTRVDHSPYFDENSDNFYEKPGFPFSRLGTDNEVEQDEKLLVAMHGRSSELLVLTNIRVSVYEIPAKKSFFKKATSVVIDQIPIVSDVLGGIDDLKDVKGGAKNFKGWLTGKNKKEKSRRADAGLPSKKEFKNVEWDIKKPEGMAMVLSYSDRILMANGFNWKSKFEASTTEQEGDNISIAMSSNEIKLERGKKKIKIKFAKKDLESYEILGSNIEKLKDSNWTVKNDGDAILISSS